MTDRELLELAAKAAGYDKSMEVEGRCDATGNWTIYIKNRSWVNGKERLEYWNPLKDDGDAFRLAVKLRIWVDYRGCSISTPAHISAHYYDMSAWSKPKRWLNEHYVPDEMFLSEYKEDRDYAKYQLGQGLVRGLEIAVRRAIVRAAAEIGKEL